MPPSFNILLATVIAMIASATYLGFSGETVTSASLSGRVDGETLSTALFIAVFIALFIMGSAGLLYVIRRRQASCSAAMTPTQQDEDQPKVQLQSSITATPLEGIATQDETSRLHSNHAQTYLDQAHSLVLVLNASGDVQYLNQHGYRLLGYPQESLQGKNWLKLCVPADQHQRITRALHDYNDSHSLAPMYIEHPVLTADGGHRLIAWNCTNIRVAPDSPATSSQLLCSGLDITENRQTQDTLHKLSCAVEQSSTSVMIFDRKGKIEYINPAFTQQTGFHADEVIGRKPTFLEGDDTDKSMLFQLRRALLRGESWQGDICYRNKNGQHFWTKERISPIKNNQQSISHYVSVSEDITAERQQQAKIEQLAFHDQLTGLPNRRSFIKQFNSAIKRCHQQNRSLTLFYLNLDHFKRINDSQGQYAGDQVLCRIAEMLRHELCQQDLIARYSSDEFLLALHDLSHDQAKVFGRRINRLVRQPVTLYNGETRLLTASIGIASFPDNSDNPSELIKFADLAMHQIKQADGNSYRFFTKQMQDELDADIFLEKQLQKAIENDEFILYYQPQVDIKNRCVIGMEALVRWIHPERGMIPPDQFIAIAERSGLIVALGQHVIRKACHGYQMLDTLGLGHLRIAINLSALQFRDPLFARNFRQILTEFRVNPSQIELELTESMLMTNIEEAISILAELKQLGTTLAIDDFGTGYSSLSYLKRLPVDIIKVDRSFIKDIPEDESDMEITAAVIAMAHKLKRKVVAEGVETPEQVSFLRENNCEYIQGYYYSQPVPESEVVAKIHHINNKLADNNSNFVQLKLDS